MRINWDTPVDDLKNHDGISYIELDDDEICHWKYIKREKIKGKWRYYYKTVKKDIKSTLSKINNKAREKINVGKKIVSKRLSSITNLASGKKKSVKEAIKSAKKRVFKYIAKVPVGDTYRYFYSTEAYQAYIRGKNAVEEKLSKHLNATPSATAQENAKNFVLKSMLSGFGKSVYKVAAPALVAMQVELTTPDSFSDLKKIDNKQSSDDHVDAINPKYKKTTYDYSMNCSFCTAAYDLRKRGYDVEANPISQVEGYTIDDVCSWYKGAKSVSKTDVEFQYQKQMKDNPREAPNKAEMLTETLKSNGEGARGHLALYWVGGGGHDIIWEVENGEVVYRDCQTGESMKDLEYLNYSYSYDYVRTDNLEPTEEVLRTVRNRK